MKHANQNIMLDDVCLVIPGAANSAYNNEAAGSEDLVHLLKGNNLDMEGGINIGGMDEVELIASKKPERYILKENDVVIMARGSAIRASFVSKEVAKKRIIASASFVIVRPNSERVRGEVIVAYLNSIAGNQKLRGLSKGTTMQHIAISDLRELEIPVPPMEVQKQISDIFYANREAYQATIALAEQQRRTANASMLNKMLQVA